MALFLVIFTQSTRLSTLCLKPFTHWLVSPSAVLSPLQGEQEILLVPFHYPSLQYFLDRPAAKNYYNNHYSCFDLSTNVFSIHLNVVSDADTLAVKMASSNSNKLFSISPISFQEMRCSIKIDTHYTIHRIIGYRSGWSCQSS
jgi:hypothetical protein